MNDRKLRFEQLKNLAPGDIREISKKHRTQFGSGRIRRVYLSTGMRLRPVGEVTGDQGVPAQPPKPKSRRIK
jgi:hypothetical protein